LKLSVAVTFLKWILDVWIPASHMLGLIALADSYTSSISEQFLSSKKSA